MTTTILIIFCSLILLSYLFDLTASKTKIPSVLLLLFLGWIVRQITILAGLELPDFSVILPVFGTAGLILIVLEGSLELELNRSRFRLITKSLFNSLIHMVLSAMVIASLFYFSGNHSFRDCVINSIPFCVISSAIAIPSVKSIRRKEKEFVTYESSFSDILGILFFTVMTLDDTLGVQAFGRFGLHLGIMIIISFAATLFLAYLLSKIKHHIKFIPIIFLIILIYAISEIYHLPSLIFILLFGLFIGNLDQFKKYKWIIKLKPDILEKEVRRFSELTVEAAFLVRAVFFLLFGYLLENTEIINENSLLWSVGVMAIIYSLRALQLKATGLPLKPLVFIAPRGLITILLFLSVPMESRIPLVNNSLVIQVIILSTLIMMGGLITYTHPDKRNVNPEETARDQ